MTLKQGIAVFLLFLIICVCSFMILHYYDNSPSRFEKNETEKPLTRKDWSVGISKASGMDSMNPLPQGDRR